MTVEAALAGALVIIAVYGALYASSLPLRVAVALAAGCLGSALVYALPTPVSSPPVVNRPIEVVEDGYASSARCVSCHPANVSSWEASYHRTMTRIASPASVLGDFEDVRLDLDGADYRLVRDGDSFAVVLPDQDRREIVMTTGSHRMQVYWFEDSGRVTGQLPFVWLIPEARWIPRNAAFLRPPGLTHHSEAGRWNETCVRCHSTHGRLGGRSLAGAETRAVELGIACEACHGPSDAHAVSMRNPVSRYREHVSPGAPATTVNPEKLDAARSSQVCGQCHGISVFHDQQGADSWAMNGFQFKPGDDLENERFPVTPENLSRPIMASVLRDPFYLEDRFWSDGVVRVSGREYNGLIASPCYRGEAFSCGSCHEMHPARADAEWADDQLLPGARGDQACLGCHEDFAGDDAVSAHTRHDADSTGSRCQNCHMPYTTYGLLKAIRSHTIESPSVANSVETGRPNACNLCHLDRSLAWAAEALERRHQVAAPRGASGDVAASVQWALEGDAGQRALIAWSMGWEPARDVSGTDWMTPILGQLLDDPYDAVRFIAFESLSRGETGVGAADGMDYDFVGSRVHRARAKREVWDRWSASGSTAPNGAVLVLDDGSYDWPRFRRLLANRNERRVSLQE